MGYVQIAAVDHRLAPVQGHEVLPQVILPLHAVVQPLQPVLGIGRVAADQVKGLVLQGDEPSLMVVLVQIHAIGHSDRGVGE